MTPIASTPKTTRSATKESSAQAASRYQQLRSHLAELKLHAAAEALPAVLDQATAEGLSLTVAMERLLAAEVDASTARRLAGRLRFACLPTPAALDCRLPGGWDHLIARGMGPPWRVNEDARWGGLGQARRCGCVGGRTVLRRPGCGLRQSVGRWPIGLAACRRSW